MRVYVYYNLHRRVLSVRAAEGPHKGLVVAHAHAVQLANARFLVSEAGRQRVIRERAKNVHAGIQGELIGIQPIVWLRDGLTAPDIGAASPGLSCDPGRVRSVTYDPYRFSSFVERGSEVPIHEAERVDIVDRDIRAAA